MKTQVSITLDHDVIEHTKDFAEYDGRSFSQYINMVMRRHLHEKLSSEIAKEMYAIPKTLTRRLK